jgi:glycosyltransferase involved in cell wall biosynthesis
VEEELAKARVLAIPALWPEPFGLVALEAYATGCPVVASRIGGLLDTVIQGVTGRLVPPGDVPALAAAIGTMLDDPGLANRMGVEGHRLIQSNFRLSMHLDRLETVYSHSMAPRK